MQAPLRVNERARRKAGSPPPLVVGELIAIPSTPETSSIGLPVSHGCLRLTLAEGRWLLSHIPLGAPTIIRE